MTKPVFIPFPNREELAQALADNIAKSLQSGISQRGSASLAVSGGSTPEAMFSILGKKDLDWANVDCLLVDDRWLADGHKDRNDSLLRRSLLAGAASTCRYLPMKTHHSSPNDGQFYLERELDALDWPLDVVHLGMGDDGHTASWFADAPEYPALLKGVEQHCMAVHPGAAPYERISLTPAAVLNSRRIVIHISGPSKQRVLEEALAGKGQYPVELVLLQSKVPVDIYWAP